MLLDDSELITRSKTTNPKKQPKREKERETRPIDEESEITPITPSKSPIDGTPTPQTPITPGIDLGKMQPSVSENMSTPRPTQGGSRSGRSSRRHADPRSARISSRLENARSIQ